MEFLGACCLAVYVSVFTFLCIDGISGQSAAMLRRYDADTRRRINLFRLEWRPGRARASLPSPDNTVSSRQAQWFKSLGIFTSGAGRRKRGLPAGFQTYERKEYRQMSREERQTFHQALLAMKARLIDGMSEYDIFVQYHQEDLSPGAHGGSAFLPWHREYLFRFELAMQSHCPGASCTIPYWDSRLDRNLPDPTDSIIWTDSFMGNLGPGTVTSGPFANWPVIDRCTSPGQTLNRRDAPIDAQALFQDDDIQRAINAASFIRLNQQEDNNPSDFEFAHGGPHVWVGGHLGNIACSPVDPVFFMHHAFVDSVWERMRERQPVRNRTLEYPTKPRGDLHAYDTVMRPFDPMWNLSGLDEIYKAFSTYSPHPERCTRSSDCGEFLFCFQGRCMSKVRATGNCTGLGEGSSEPCECGRCFSGRCDPCFDP